MSGISRHIKNERGMVSIMVTMLLLIIVSLIVLGFASIARRNQRESLDRQLSTQAFYAAETGINDVRDIIRQNIDAGTGVASKTDCDASSVAAYAPPALNPIVDAANKISYTCVLIDPAPTKLVYNDIGTTSTIVPLIPVAGTIANVNLSWQSKDAGTTPVATCPSGTVNVFAKTTNWTCGYGVLRIDLVNTAGTLTQSGLQNGTMTTFLVPNNGVGSNSVAFAAGPTFATSRLGVRCDNTDCHLTITGLSSTQYYLRASSLYKDVSVQVTATDASNNALELQGAQAVIDATGKAQDVLRRVQVHVPLTPSSTNQLPDYAIQSTDAVCKRFVTMDGYFRSDALTAVPGLTPMTANPLCQ